MKIKIQYFAQIREERGVSSEILTTDVETAKELYFHLQKEYRFNLSTDLVKVAVNDEFVAWDTKLKDNDSVVFIPPVAGG